MLKVKWFIYCQCTNIAWGQALQIRTGGERSGLNQQERTWQEVDKLDKSGHDLYSIGHDSI